jgi:5-methylcytosine-specific restriction endonuclease McrBC regulatory subunit McrC
MSKIFLLNKTSSYNVDDTESFCFLFPTEVLFEGFIGGFLQSVLGNEGKVRLQASEMYLIDDIVYKGKSYGSKFKMRHDILAEYKDKVFVLDTKYKRLSRFDEDPEIMDASLSDVKDADLRQIGEYAIKRGLLEGYLLYPMYRYEEADLYSPQLLKRITVDGKDYVVTIYIVRLPFVFEDDVEHTKQMLATSIQTIFQ